MTATLTQVRQALAAVLGTVDGLNPYAFRAGTIVEPAAVVTPAPGEFLNFKPTLATAVDMRLLVGLFVSAASDEAGSTNLDAFLADSGPSSIYAALAADSTLGGLVDDASLTAAQDYGTYSYNSVDYYGCEFLVEVML